MIEDNPADTSLLRHALREQEEPFVLLVLEDGEQALRYVRERCSEYPEPCLIVLDLHLPKYSGITVLRAIRSEPQLEHIKVVTITSVVSPEEQAEVLALGVQAYRNKPMDWEGTVALARELIQICSDPAPRTLAQTNHH